MARRNNRWICGCFRNIIEKVLVEKKCVVLHYEWKELRGLKKIFKAEIFYYIPTQLAYGYHAKLLYLKDRCYLIEKKMIESKLSIMNSPNVPQCE